MTTQIIAENILRSTHFSSATEQAGPYWKQAVPTVTGKFRMQAQGTPSSTFYSGTTTSSGSSTTVIDSALTMLGDDFLIGCTVTITSGTCSGQSAAITDFAQATGTITTAAFTATIGSSVTYTITAPTGTRDFRVQLITGGNAGDATFKWSHNGGTTWMGRDDPDAATWLGSRTLIAAAGIDYDAGGYNRVCVLQLASGNVIALYAYGNDLYRKVSTDGGLSFGAGAAVEGTFVGEGAGSGIYCATQLSSGRILLTVHEDMGGLIYYSDDDGASWGWITSNLVGGADTGTYILELSGPNHLLGARCVSSDRIWVQISDDGGETWGTPVAVSDATGVQKNPVLLKNRKGEILCIFESSEDSGGVFDLKYQLSTDNGVTWAADALIFDASGTNDYFSAHAVMDLNGDLYAVCAYQAAGAGVTTVHLKRSVDDGTTWATDREVSSTTSGGILDQPWIALLDSGTMMITHFDGSGNCKACFRGMWETYSSNACPCRMDTKPHKLISGAKIAWLGGQGEVDDSWTFTAGYHYGAINLLQPSPALPFRTTQDGIACAIVFDAGAYNRFTMSGAAFFGCNVRTLSFQMADADSWASPTVNQTVSFDKASGIIHGVYGDDTFLCNDLDTYEDHELAGMYVIMTSGSDSGSAYKIADNQGGYITLSGITASTAFTTSDEFTIYQTHAATTFTRTSCRYIRIYIAALDTAEEYYQIGTLIPGSCTTLNNGWARGYKISHEYPIQVQRGPSQQPIVTSLGTAHRVFSLTWPAHAAPKEITAILNLLNGKPYCIIPDSTNLLDCYLVFSIGPATETHVASSKYTIDIEAEEVT